MAQGHETFYGTKTSPDLARSGSRQEGHVGGVPVPLPCWLRAGSRPRSTPPRVGARAVRARQGQGLPLSRTVPGVPFATANGTRSARSRLASPAVASAGDQQVRPPASGSADDEYRWHTGSKRPSGARDAVEFVDVHKAFGRNKILRGLNLGLPEGKISMILGPSGHGQVGLHQAHGRAAVSRPRGRARARRVGPGHDRRPALQDAPEVRRPVSGRRALRLDERLRQRLLSAAPAHGAQRGGDRRDRQPAPCRGRPAERPRQDAQRALRRGCASAPGSLARSSSTRTSSSSTSPTRAWTPSARLLGELIQEIHADMMGEARSAARRRPRSRSSRTTSSTAQHIAEACRSEGPHGVSPARRTSSWLPTTSSCASSWPVKSGPLGMDRRLRSRRGLTRFIAPRRWRPAGPRSSWPSPPCSRDRWPRARPAPGSPTQGCRRSSARSSPARAATETLRERFGDDAIIVLVRGDLQKLVLSQDIERLLALEGCVAGNAPAGAALPGGPRGPCRRLRAQPPGEGGPRRGALP